METTSLLIKVKLPFCFNKVKKPIVGLTAASSNSVLIGIGVLSKNRIVSMSMMRIKMQ